MNQKLIGWVVNGDMGASSLTLWTVIMGEPCDKSPSIPYDSGDFGRCYRLLQLIPESQRMQIMAETAQAYPNWIPFAREWKKLTRLYETENTTTKKPKLYKLMEKLADESERKYGM